MGWLGTAWDYTVGKDGIGLAGDLGLKKADDSNLKEDREGYGGIATTAGQTLGQAVAAPQAVAPAWERAGVTNAQWQNANATQAGITEAGAASMAPVFMNFDQANQARASQNALIAQLQSQAAGVGPSVAQEQLRQATAGNINQQMAAARSMHGAARLAALRNASTIGAATQQQAASQATALRAQEIANAQAALGSIATNQRAQDLAASTQQANLMQQMALTNAGFQQQAGLTNAQLAQNARQFDAGAVNAMAQFNANAANAAQLANAGAANTASLSNAQQANSGNQAFGLANLQGQLQTNSLNAQLQQAYINALLNAQAGKVGIDASLMGAEDAWNATKRGLIGNTINKAGEVLGVPGFTKNDGSGGASGMGGNFSPIDMW